MARQPRAQFELFPNPTRFADPKTYRELAEVADRENCPLTAAWLRASAELAEQAEQKS